MTVAAPPTAVVVDRRTDAELLAALANASAGVGRAACDELVRRYVDFVYAAARRLLSDSHAAEDVTQAVFIVLARRGGRVRPQALGRWLHETTRHAAANARRAARRRKTHESAAAKPEATMPYVLPEPDPLLALLDDAIGSLRARDRTAVIDRYLRGRDVEAIAATLHTTPAAAQKRLERAVVRLRKYFVRAGVPTAAAAVAVTLASVAPTPANAAPAGLAAAGLPPAFSTAGATPTALVVKGGLAVLTATQIKIAAGLVLATCVLAGVGVRAVRREAPPPVANAAGVPTTLPAVSQEAAGVLDAPGGGTVERGTPLGEVFAHLSRGSGHSVYTAWPKLAPFGIAPTTPLTVDLTGLILGDALHRVLAEVEGAPLAFSVDGGVVTVSTVTDLAGNVDTRTYDVRTLVRPDTAGGAERAKDLERRVRGLNPLSWASRASVNAVEHPGTLIVTQSPAMHARIASELGRGQPASVQAQLRAMGERPVPPPFDPTSPVGRTLAALDKPTASFRMDGVAFDDALSVVDHTAGVTVDPQWPALNAIGVRKDTPVTVRVDGGPYRKNLATLLKAVSAPTPMPAPAYAVSEDGRVVVTSRADLVARFAARHAYPLDDLLRGRAGDRNTVIEQTLVMVRETIDPDTWAKRPGEAGGTCAVDGDVLNVIQTPDVQERVAGLLRRLAQQARDRTEPPR